MKRTARVLAVILALWALLVLLALPVVAASEETPTESTTTTVAASSGLEPAVEVSDEAAAPAQADWTYRYLVPTGLLLAVVVAAFTSVRYFTNVVRKRYRIVEE